MTKKIVRPILPIAPSEYDAVFVNQLARSADVNFQGISSSGAANVLEAGDFYVGEAGFLRIVEKNEIYSGSVEGTTSLGTVTVTVS